MLARAQTGGGILVSTDMAGRPIPDRITANSATCLRVTFRRATRDLFMQRLRGKTTGFSLGHGVFQGRAADTTRFQSLYRRWKRETRFLSFTGEIVMNAAYQHIMAMGPTIVPNILRQLSSEGDSPSYWFWALEHLTNDDPVPSDERGNARAMRNRWLNWAREHGVAV